MISISPCELAAQAQRHPGSHPCIDVRSATEFAAGHLPASVNIPLDQLEARLDDVPKGPIVLICKSGKRARMAAGLLAACRSDLSVLEGGTDAWSKANLPLVVSMRTRWSLERQVRLGAGILVLAGTLLALSVSRYGLALIGFVGLGLTFAGLTDICAMGSLLSLMPWNRTRVCKPTGHGKEQCCS